MSRLQALQSASQVSVLVIGGGINGIGTFRDLALNGVDVVLVEKADFGSGASAASSHMLHGGIRYLENGEFRLVREALTERNLMLKNAPHYAKPLPTTIPIFRWFSGFLNAPLKFLGLRDKPSERGAVVIKIGLILYDLFARSYKVMPDHSLHLRAESLRRYPKINDSIVCTASYYDAWMPYPERICLELVLDTLAAAPHAHALNYVTAIRADADTVTLRDEVTGEVISIRPQVVINATGAWIDFTNDALGKPTRFIGGTKGSHVILDNPELHAAADGHEIFFENRDGRIVLILPFLGKVMIGTTDIRITDPEQAVCTDDEITYMLDLVKRVFPTIPVDRSQIVFQFSGVRPLPNSDASRTGSISRDHSIELLGPQAGLQFPIFSLIGGKWTTFRAFAEQTADRVLAHLKRPRSINTATLPIGGGRDYPQDSSAWIKMIAAQTGLTESRVGVLFERYGTRGAEIARYCVAAPDQVLRATSDYTVREIRFLVEHEHVIHVDDLLLRRTVLAWLGYVNRDLLEEVIDICASVLGWEIAIQERERQRTIALLAAKHGIHL
ncbi:MAG: glycerol-3-phosphate dehydrogenase/oxidase [Anaerolineae bacterium]|nr:glycerol-3-phosphate dehydrogenase/oxidase [Anaerolineae bacterium]